MKRAILFLFLAFLAFQPIWSQNFEISGKVVDQDNEPIPFANIVLLTVSDSTFVKGTASDETGIFRLDEVLPDLYYLQASFIENTSEVVALDVKQTISIGALVVVNSTKLSEVVVRGKKPTISRLPDRLIFNVENTVVAEGSSWDILRSTPGVIANESRLLIRGEEATVFINDRRVQLTGNEIQALLQGFSGNSVSSVEVITNPSAAFDADTGPVLNIKTNKPLVPGYKGSINGNFTQAVFPKSTLGMSHYFKTNKLNVFANYSFTNRKDLVKTTKGIDFFEEDLTTSSIWNTQYEQINSALTHNATVIADYDIDKRNTLNFTANMVLNPDEDQNTILNTNIFNGQQVLDSTFTTQNLSDLNHRNIGLDVSYIHRLKKEGAQFNFNVHYTDYQGEFFQQLSSDYFDATGVFLRDFGFNASSDQDINIFTAQVDFSMPLESGSVEAGLKRSEVKSENRLIFDDFFGSSNTVDESQSDIFDYDEEVYAVYASYLKDWEKWSVKLGLRGELTQATGVSATLGETTSQDFFEPFPSVNILYSPSDKNSFAFDYSRGIQRPKYNDLNPFRFFYNENDFEEGNPGLFPSFSNNFNINYTLNSTYFFDFYYRDNGENITYLVFQDNDARTLRELKQNVLASKSYGFDFTVSKNITPNWFLYAYTSFFHEEETFLATESNNVEFTAEVDGFYGYLANYLTLSEDGTFTGEITMTYLSQFLFGSYISDDQLNLTLGLRKSLFDNRITLSLAAEDLLEQYIPSYRSRYLNQDNFYRRRRELQFIRFGFTYNFGNFRLQDNQRGIDNTERNRLVDE
ncbi:MAG: outer membrane beta-barrel family protein [Bacteroidota bacterium]